MSPLHPPLQENHSDPFILNNIGVSSTFYYRAMLAQSAVMRLLSFVRLSVCPSVRNAHVPCSNTLEFFENNFTAKQLKVHALVDAQHGRSGAKETPPKLGWNIGCELELD